jgi:hypothetical protein
MDFRLPGIGFFETAARVLVHPRRFSCADETTKTRLKKDRKRVGGMPAIQVA